MPGASDGLLTALGGRVEAPLRDTTMPNIWQWNVTVQRELPARHPRRSRVRRQPRPRAVARRRRRLHAESARSVVSVARVGAQSARAESVLRLTSRPARSSLPTVARGQLLRPYPQFGDIIPLFYQGAESSYDAFQLTVSRRLRERRSASRAATSRSKSMDWGQSYQNAYDLSSANALSGVHVPYRVVAQRHLSAADRTRSRDRRTHVTGARRDHRRLAGERHLDAAGRADARHRRHQQLGRSSARASARTGTGRIRRSTATRRTSSTRWFDPTVFSQPAPFTFGNAPERIPGLRAHHLNSVDFSLFKEVQPAAVVAAAAADRGVQRAATTCSSASPNTTLNSATVGQVTSQANAPRQMQFGVKAIW